jgi:hypothetical protein
MTAVKPGDAAWDPAELIREQAALLERAARDAPPDRRASHLLGHLRDDVLGRYDGRFLACDDDLRRHMTAGTRTVLDAWLTDDIRARLPIGHRMRAFCIQHDLIDELARLVEDEAAGRREGGVVVGGRVYALYPYLRGVPRRDADITAEVGVDHRLGAVTWAGDALRIRGRASIERVAARDEHVEIVLLERTSGAERRFGTVPRDAGDAGDASEDKGRSGDGDCGCGCGCGCGAGDANDTDGFSASVPMSELCPGQWDVHVSVRALGLVRQAPMGAVRDDGLDGSLPDRPEATAYFTGDGHLAVAVHGRARRLTRTWWRRLTRRSAS